MESKGLYLNEIPQSGEITLQAAVVEKEIRPKRNGGSYLALRLADRSGEDWRIAPENWMQRFGTIRKRRHSCSRAAM
jgi:hypothetical protein